MYHLAEVLFGANSTYTGRETSLTVMTMASSPVERVTMFKIASWEDREKVLDAYRVLKRTNEKVSLMAILPLSFFQVERHASLTVDA